MLEEHSPLILKTSLLDASARSLNPFFVFLLQIFLELPRGHDIETRSFVNPSKVYKDCKILPRSFLENLCAPIS